MAKAAVLLFFFLRQLKLTAIKPYLQNSFFRNKSHVNRAKHYHLLFNLQQMFLKRLLLFLLCLISAKGVSLLVDKSKIMTPEITVPYFSGAALSADHQNWIFNLNEVDTIKKLNFIENVQEKRKAIDNYRFSSIADSTHQYQLNQPGLIYAIRLAKTIFFFQGDIGALKSFQLLIHCCFCFLTMLSFKTTLKRLLFFLLYFINPAILYLTIFPFYYFWQVIGSYLIVLILLNPKKQTFFILLLSSLLLACIYHIRISTLPLSIFILIFGFYHIAPLRRVIALGVFIVTVYIMQPGYLAKHPGHVMYSSLGAYPGSPVRGFSDNISFADYSKATGKNYSYESTPSMYDSEVIMGEAKWGMEKFTEFAKENPFIILRNATLNIFESFSFGYMTSSVWLTYLSAFTGFIFFVVLFGRKKYSLIVLILASSCSYILYLAPVPIYLYGTFLISVYALLEIIPEKKVK